MRAEFLEYLRTISPEEQRILDGDPDVQKDLYFSGPGNVIDSRKLLQEGRLIDLRTHTRFIHFPEHRHNYVEMVYMLSGTLTNVLNGTDRVVLEPGDLLLMNPHATQEILPAGEEDIAVNFIILPEFFERPLFMLEQEDLLRDFFIGIMTGEDSLYDYLHLHTKGILSVENLLENMIWTLIDRRVGTNTINQTTMGLLLMNLSRFADNVGEAARGSELQNTLLSVIRYVDREYRDGTLEEIAAQLGYSACYLSRLLKDHTGSNFKQLLQKRKLQQAVHLLENTTLSADRIMEEIGYENSSYFYKIFRERYGCSPREYRQKG